MRLLIFLCVALAVVWFAQRREWEQEVPTARDLGATAAEILEGFQEGELLPILRTESAVADSSAAPRPESEIADSSVSVKSSGPKIMSRDSFGTEAEVTPGVASREEFATANSGPGRAEEFATANSGLGKGQVDARVIKSRLDRVMSLAAGRDR